MWLSNCAQPNMCTTAFHANRESYFEEGEKGINTHQSLLLNLHDFYTYEIPPHTPPNA